MSRICNVCSNPKRKEIDKLLINSSSIRVIASQFSLTFSSVQRHYHNHLPSTLIKAKEVEVITQADNLLEQVKDLQRRALSILDAAEVSGDLRTALGAIQVARGNLELLGRLANELQVQQKQEVTINVHYAGCTCEGKRGVKRLSGGREYMTI